MADINVGTIYEGAAVAEDVGVNVISLVNINDGISIAEAVTGNVISQPSVYSGVTVSESLEIDIYGEGSTEVSTGTYVMADIHAAGFYTKSLIPMYNSIAEGYMNVSVAGSFTGTAVLQRSFDRGVTWRTVASYTSAVETYCVDKEIGVMYRMGVTVWSAGQIQVRLGISRAWK